ncbi:MAG TPA: methylenetetrahydrofolate--tRNA-(uracil(54)-C(5))-methyltransferase (FADH(2)-oxidizing) TrmFO, partial [Deltaproteobacteria bacterium]|nr:methylenetetrahydrofolate--tRNA-(uracil(54)-C(5))-methyltransferase (FADH(2)-oxidizing) TrmFO [Deltaproteobacteria bacterium]
FMASRYQEGEGDYINCPLDHDEYENLHREIVAGREIQLHGFEDRRCFEACLPIEVLARRGIDTLRYGPMKPVGLMDPRTGKQPWAVVQLRRENLQGSLYNIVGFQTKLAYPEQKRIFRMIPGLEDAEFARYGSIHRNTFIDSPRLLTEHLELRSRPGVFFAGQITGVEGYLESAASGLLAGINAALLAGGTSCTPPPPETAIGALVTHVTNRDTLPFQPMNVNFGLFPRLEKRIQKKERGAFRARLSAEHIARWKAAVDAQVFLS